jgi:alkylation response protein AidB-like acyl-CoA dehydrogenase
MNEMTGVIGVDDSMPTLAAASSIGIIGAETRFAEHIPERRAAEPEETLQARSWRHSRSERRVMSNGVRVLALVVKAAFSPAVGSLTTSNRILYTLHVRVPAARSGRDDWGRKSRTTFPLANGGHREITHGSVEKPVVFGLTAEQDALLTATNHILYTMHVRVPAARSGRDDGGRKSRTTFPLANGGHREITHGSVEKPVVFGLTAEEDALVTVVEHFVEKDVRPVAAELDHNDEYPGDLIETMKQIGLFGLTIPPPFGQAHASTRCLALVTEELSRGWMSLAGAIGGHLVVARLILMYGTEQQRERYLPRMATGEIRASMALTEPSGGSDLQSIRTTATSDGHQYIINGSKIWITNARRSKLCALLCKTDPHASPPHEGISIVLAEPGDGFTISRDLGKLGYRGVESCEMFFQEYVAPRGALLGGEEGQGFPQMMAGLELGRIQVAARAVGVARAAFESALTYARDRETFGKPIWQHQAIGHYLANMATELHASRLLILHAADKYDSGCRCDLESGMAKLFASEACLRITTDAMRIHGSYGYSTDLPIERYFRDAPLMIIGEGTNEIQRTIIARRLARSGDNFFRLID